MAENIVKRYPFSNKGLVQKIDVNQLGEGQYAYLLNMVSQQEGAISPRNGYEDITTGWTVSLVHSMMVTRSGITTDPTVYAGEGTNIYRVGVSGTVATPGTAIATGVTTAAKRIGITQYKTDQYNHTGTAYFATGYNDSANNFRGMLRDASDAAGTYPALARVWGILPPVIPAAPTPAAPDVVPAGNIGTSGTRYTDTIVSVAPASYGSDYYAIVVSSVTGLQTGMYVLINSVSAAIGDIDVATNTIYVALPSAPSTSNTVIAYESPSVTSAGPATSDTLTFTANLALSGVFQNGYDSNDNIHLSFYNGVPGNIKSWTLRLYTNSGSASYYSYDVTINETAPSVPPSPYWIEYDIPKSSFTSNGTGSGDNSWNNVTSSELVVTPIDDTVAFDFKYGQIFGIGGSGPNSGSSVTLNPYDYVYTYQDPVSGAESNPSQVMAPKNALSVTQQAIKVNFWGTNDTDYNAGTTKVIIYRRGGSYTDGLFRRVGVTDNPGQTAGSPDPGSFLDSVDDLSISNSVVAEFDNDAPVTSDLNREYVGALASTYVHTATVSLTGISTNFTTILTPGTIITVGSDQASNQETVVAYNVTSTTFDAYFQYSHATGEAVTWSTNAGIACDIVLAAQECLWVAGNVQNPHVLYRSKTGRPESFPIINEATGNAHSLAISSPDNPINGIAEFGGEIIVLCQNSIYRVQMNQGVMTGPFATQANRGLTQKYAWGKVDNELWFLSYDGIYAYSAGGTIRKVTLPLDFVFNNRTVNGVAPYDKTGTATGVPLWPTLCNIAQRNNEVFFNYIDTSGIFLLLRYNLLFDRWSVDEVYDVNSTTTSTRNGFTLRRTSITCMASDRATGDLFAVKSTTSAGPITRAGFLYYDKENFFADGGTSAPGTQPIYYDAITPYFDLGAPFTQKNFTDIAVELTSGVVAANNVFKATMYYDYSATANIADTFTITPSTTGRQIIPLPLQQTGGAATWEGKNAKAAQIEIYGTATAYDIFHGFAFGYIPLADIIRGRVLDWDDLGHPYDKRLGSVTIEYDNSNVDTPVALDIISGIDGGTPTYSVQSFTLPAAVGRSKIPLAINDNIVAKMVRLRPTTSSSIYQIFDYKFTQDNYPKDRIFFTDYSDEGYEYEKRLFQLYINCDTNGQDVSVTIQADNSNLQTVTVNGTANNRMQSIPINPDKIGRLIRLSVSSTAFSGNPSAKFQYFGHSFDYEKLPKPTVLSTEWNDFGYDYDKWAEQISLEVNTNGQNIPVQIYADGVLKQTVTVNTTYGTPSKNITLNPGITFNTMRLIVDSTQIPAGGRFQLWTYRPIFKPADKGEVYHTFDWDNLEHPYDKKLTEVTIEFETGGLDVQVAIDTLTGINGNIQNLNAFTLTLNSTGRGYKTFPLPESISPVKMVRIRCLGTNGGGTNNPDFKMWGYAFSNVIKYPADILTYTDWDDLGSPCPKIFRGFGIEINTGGVNCVIALQVDGSTKQSWTVNTTSPTRLDFLSLQNSTEIEGNMYRLTFTPANSSGLAQVFGAPTWSTLTDSCPFVFWDSEPQAFGSAGFTIIKQVWFDYRCTGTVTMKFYNEEGQLFHTKSLPAQTYRGVARFYLPSVGSTGVINKSKKHRWTIEADDPTKRFFFLRDSSRIETIQLSADQRKGYYQTIYWTQLPLQT